jgi:hypothetical protein
MEKQEAKEIIIVLLFCLVVLIIIFLGIRVQT